MNPQITHRPPVIRPDMPAPAPTLTDDWKCSDCGVKSVTAAGGDLRVCPKCYSVLWHVDWSEEGRRKKEEALAAAAMGRYAARQERKAMRTTLHLSAGPVTTSSPSLEPSEIGEPENDH
jgi:hypothetical protein